MGFLNKVFFKIGYYSASNPGTACFLALMTTVVCSLGFINYRVTVSIGGMLGLKWDYGQRLTSNMYRATLRSFGYRLHRVPILNRPTSTSSLGHSSA